MRIVLITIFADMMLVLLMVMPAQAARIVDTDAVTKAASRGAILWDVREAEAYLQAHIPGAVNTSARVCSQLRTPGRWDPVSVERIARQLGAWGIDPEREIIIYGDKGGVCPYFILVSLEAVGAKDVHVYHGGMDDWKAAGHPIATAAVKLPPVTLDLHVQPGVIVSTDEIHARLTRRDVQILDVRTPSEFTGLDVRALRGGHIPRAVNIPYEQNWIDPEIRVKLQKKLVTNNDGFSLKAAEDLQQVYAKLDPSLETVVYCHGGSRAMVTVSVLKDIGFRDVRVYDASWVGYGNRFDLPAEDETFFDTFSLTSRLGEMQQRIDALEKQVAELKAGK